MTARGFLLLIQMQMRPICAHNPKSLFCKHKHLLFDEWHTKTIRLYSLVPDLWTCRVKPHSSEQLSQTPT